MGPSHERTFHWRDHLIRSYDYMYLYDKYIQEVSLSIREMQSKTTSRESTLYIGQKGLPHTLHYTTTRIMLLGKSPSLSLHCLTTFLWHPSSEKITKVESEWVVAVSLGLGVGRLVAKWQHGGSSRWWWRSHESTLLTKLLWIKYICLEVNNSM